MNQTELLLFRTEKVSLRYSANSSSFGYPSMWVGTIFLLMGMIKFYLVGDGTGVVVRTHAFHAEDLGSIPIPKIVIYDTKFIVTTSFGSWPRDELVHG